MRWLIVLPLLLASLIACAQPRPAGLYYRDQDGSMEFNCTAFPTEHRDGTYTFLTAEHCVGAPQLFLSFDADTPVFYPVVATGPEGDDFAFLQIKTSAKIELFQLGDSDTIKVGDNTEAIALTFGMGEGVYRGHVVMTKLTRPLEVGPGLVDITRYFMIQMPVAGGASGGPVLKNGKVVGILCAQRGNFVAIALKINVVK